VKAKRALLPDLTKARVLVVGDVMPDRYWFGEVRRSPPEAPVTPTMISFATAGLYAVGHVWPQYSPSC